MRANPQAWPRAERRRETRTFVDVGTGQEIEITLQEMDGFARAAVATIIDAYRARYLTGEVLDGEQVGPFPLLIDGEPVPLTEDMLRMLSVLVAMQPAAEVLGYEPYSFEDFAHVAKKAVDAWSEIQSWANSFLATERERLPNMPGASLAA